MNLRAVPLAAVLTASLALTACGSDDGEQAAAAEDDGLQVAASFYPLQFVAERVAGDRASVTNLTPPGAEAHDLELAPQDVASLTEADVVLHQAGFQPSVDDAITSAGIETAFDVSSAADLDVAAAGDPHAGEEADAHGDEHAEDDAHAEEHAEGGADPHFWLDPIRLAGVGDAVAERLGEIDPDGAAAYEEGATQLRADLAALDAEMQEGLASCTNRDLVTSHEAFAYLADRYGFEQVGISGLSPEDEPTPAQLAEVTDFVRDHGVSTVYFETLVSPDIAETVAAETGASTAVLDPLEGLTDSSAGSDYVEVMRANLQALRAGQSCA